MATARERAQNPELARVMRWLARGVFVAAVALLVLQWGPWRRRAPEPPRVAGRTPLKDWTLEPWDRWTSRRYGVSLERPAGWAADEPFEDYTEHALGDLKVAVVVGFREASPIVVYRYRAPRELPWSEWRRRAAKDAEFRREFGSEILRRRAVTVSGLPALELEAQGAVRSRLWYSRSLLFARGRLAFRVTVGADHRDWPTAQRFAERVLRSVRYELPEGEDPKQGTTGS